jgi:hypothetical protein
MNIVVNPDLKAYIDPLTPDEHDALERSLLAEGCRDALVLWGDVLVDGHNRFGICQKHGIAFQTLQSNQFKTMDDVHLWMIDQHLGRRSVSDFQRGVLALRKREILNDRRLKAADTVDTSVNTQVEAPHAPASTTPTSEPLKSREDIAKVARLSSNQVVLIEKIQKQAAAEVVAAVKSGTISLNAAAAVSSLPEDEQVAAALGGKEQLRQAAKRVRETKKRNTTDNNTSEETAQHSVEALKLRIQELETENARLREELAALTL